MNAVPHRFPPTDIPNYKQYRCPVSGTAATGELAPDRWVFCPLVPHKPICYGACLDLQSAARDKDFDENPDVYLFSDLAKKLRVDIDSLRRECLEHQKLILEEMLNDPSEDPGSVGDLLRWVQYIRATQCR
jgi:hypothetical protein